MAEEYTAKVIYHFIEDGDKLKQIQLFERFENAIAWGAIQRVRGFLPVSVEDNTYIDEGMVHVGDEAPQVHQGHYSEVKSKETL